MIGGMTLIADGLLIGAALTAAIYCHVLARRLKRLGDLDRGLGGAVAALSRQAEDLRRAMEAARKASGEQTRELARRTARAEAAAGRLEILIAAMHEAESRLPRPLVRAAETRPEPELEDFAAPSPAGAARAAMRGESVEDLDAARDDEADAEADGDAPRRDGLAAAIRALARGGAS